MQLIIERVTVTNKSWFYLFTRTKLRFGFGDTELVIVPVTENLNRIVEYTEPMLLTMTNKDVETEKQITVSPGESIVTIEDSQLCCQFHVRCVNDTWNSLDPLIESIGKYHKNPYYINDKTLETSYNGKFVSSQSSFPSFRQCLFQRRLFFVDCINKIVINISPMAEHNAVKDALKGILRNNPIQYGTTRIVIDRERLLQSGASALLNSVNRIRTSMPIFTFKDEIGEDYGAIRREFFYFSAKAVLADPRLTCTDGLYDIQPGGSCPEFIYDFNYIYESIADLLQETECIKDDRIFYLFVGVLLGSLIFFRETINANFSLAFYENLLKREYTIRHIQDVEFQRSVLQCIRDPSLGYDSAAIQHAVEEKLYLHKQNQYDYIRLGFLAIFPDSLPGITAFNLPFIFYHFEPISILKLMKYVCYERCTPDTKEVRWLWEILNTKGQDYLSRFLLFFTGSGTFPSFDEEVKLTIEQLDGRDLFLTASSCANRLFIGNYNSKDNMEHFIDYSINNTIGFHKV